jgi:hypothetical protein
VENVFTHECLMDGWNEVVTGVHYKIRQVMPQNSLHLSSSLDAPTTRHE